MPSAGRTRSRRHSYGHQGQPRAKLGEVGPLVRELGLRFPPALFAHRRYLAFLGLVVAGSYLERRAAVAAAGARLARLSDAIHYLAHIHEVPVHVSPCVEGPDGPCPVAV
jgi:hypothetical protein